jgi:hypothetical protein
MKTHFSSKVLNTFPPAIALQRLHAEVRIPLELTDGVSERGVRRKKQTGNYFLFSEF